MAYRTQSLTYKPAPSIFWILMRLFGWLLSWVAGVILLVGVVGWNYDQLYKGRIFEGVSINGVDVGGLTAAEARALLHERLPVADDERLVLHLGSESWIATTYDLGIRLDAETSIQDAFRVGRTGQIQEQWIARFLLWYGASANGQITPLYTRDPIAIDALVTRIANEVTRKPQDASLIVLGLSVRGTPAIPGRQLDVEASREQIVQGLANNERHIELVVTPRQPHVIGAQEVAEKARALLSEPLLLYFEQPDYRQVEQSYVPTRTRRQWMVRRARLAEMLVTFGKPLDNGQHTFDVRLKPELLGEELEALVPIIRRYPRDARFDFDPDTGSLTPLVISQDGLRLDVEASLANIEEAIREGEHEIKLAVRTIPPQVSLADMDKMNITGLAVTGFSDYTDSSDEREVNIAIATDQYQGLVIAPGSTFSFNEHLGWVVDANGYEEGYIISGNQTEVDVGGGVCQVSTTLFRAAFNAGFEITERHAHAYRVPYYENGSPLGWDATVFAPWVDFKFRNNTPNYYLMEVENNRAANTLQFNLYGSPTGRDVELVSKTIETIPHGPPIYEDDPTLPVGVTEQVDWEHEGATIVVYRVIRDSQTGAEIERDEFWSEFEPWQARYQVGTGGQ